MLKLRGCPHETAIGGKKKKKKKKKRRKNKNPWRRNRLGKREEEKNASVWHIETTQNWFQKDLHFFGPFIILGKVIHFSLLNFLPIYCIPSCALEGRVTNVFLLFFSVGRSKYMYENGAHWHSPLKRKKKRRRRRAVKKRAKRKFKSGTTSITLFPVGLCAKAKSGGRGCYDFIFEFMGLWAILELQVCFRAASLLLSLRETQLSSR